MTGAEIIAKFNVYVDDDSQLSSSEELALLNDIIQNVVNHRTWNWLKKEHTDTMSTSVPYIALPSDFGYMLSNDELDGEDRVVVYVGADSEPYIVVSFSDRRNYRDKDGFAYIDRVNSRLVFTKQPSEAKSVEFDYFYIPDDLSATSETPVIPSRFHKILVHGMAMDHNIIEQSEKARSYRAENEVEYARIMARMEYADSQDELVNGY